MFILQSQNAGLFNMFFFLAILLVMYFFFIRPQAKKQKEQVAFINNLKKGDEVVTGSGIIAKVNKIEPKAITLQLDQKTFLKVVPSAISREMTSSHFAKSEDK